MDGPLNSRSSVQTRLYWVIRSFYPSFKYRISSRAVCSVTSTWLKPAAPSGERRTQNPRCSKWVWKIQTPMRTVVEAPPTSTTHQIDGVVFFQLLRLFVWPETWALICFHLDDFIPNPLHGGLSYGLWVSLVAFGPAWAPTYKLSSLGWENLQVGWKVLTQDNRRLPFFY